MAVRPQTQVALVVITAAAQLLSAFNLQTCKDFTRIDRRKFRIGFAEGLRNSFVFLNHRAASGVHQAAARFQHAGGTLQDGGLRHGHLLDQCQTLTPFQIRVAPQRPQTRARRIHQHAVNFAGQTLDAVVTLIAKLANGKDLPSWVQFDARAGTFQLSPPTGFNDELQVKVVARDSEGREASSIFKFTVGEGKGKANTSSRSSLSEQIRLAAKRSAPWLELVRQQDSKAPADKLPPAQVQAVARQMQARG